MKTLAIVVGTFIVSLVLAGLVFLAMIGGLFLITEHRPTEAEHCDRIDRINGTLYCMAEMKEEDDNIMVLRGHQQL